MERRSIVTVAAAVLALLATACGGPDSGGALQPPGATDVSPAGDAEQVDVLLMEWTVAADPASAEARHVTFRVANEGTQDHEFVILVTDLPPDELPTTEEAVVDTAADGVEQRSELEAFPPGESATLTVTLDPGSHVLICNLPGHYQLGMRAAFTVR